MSYVGWKDWQAAHFGSLRTRDRRYYDAEMKRTRLDLNTRLQVVEVGFGNGSFLNYAKQRGWDITGIELHSDLVETAKSHGFTAIQSSTLEPLPHGQFDLIVAIDVLEHLSTDQVFAFLRECRRVLRKGGMLLARFPNGDSPFGLKSQNGDITHASVIGTGKITYFAKEMGAAVVFVGGQAQPIPDGDIRWTLYRLFALPLRKLVDLLARLVFTPTGPIFFSSTELVMVLRME
jgi:2-polyprenyl-3-methyl-5-hydroxy-6-metoxy-1,4-benzoquinol methylase